MDQLNLFDLHQLYMATFLLATSIALLIYHLLRPEIRPRILRRAISLAFLGFVTFGAVVVILSPGQDPPWIQTLGNNIQALIYTAVASYICYLAGNNQGAKYGRLGPFCRSAPYVLGCLWLAMLVFGLVYPSSFVDDSPVEMSHFWALKIRNVIELFFIAASAAIFIGEALRYLESPFRTLKLQNAAFAAGSVSGCMLVIAAATGAIIQAYDWPFGTDQPNVTYPLQLTLLIATVTFWSTGAVLYHSNDENARTINIIRKWVQKRHDLEIEFDTSFRGRVGNFFTHQYFRNAAERIESVQLSTYNYDCAAYLIKLLHYLQNPTTDNERVRHLYQLQKELSRPKNQVSSHMLVKIDQGITYDLKGDSLYAAVYPALVLSQPTSKIDLIGEPEWYQLAAVVAAEAGYLECDKAQIILDPATCVVGQSILDAYQEGKAKEEFVETRL